MRFPLTPRQFAHAFAAGLVVVALVAAIHTRP